MEDEFERIMAFFSLDPKEKEKRLQEVFQDSIEYFERFKQVMVKGTAEEKQQAIKKVMALKEKIEGETKRICEHTGMTEEELTSYSTNAENFTPDQWRSIEEAKKKLETNVSDIAEAIQKTAGEDKQEAPKPTDVRMRGKRKKPKNWIQS